MKTRLFSIIFYTILGLCILIIVVSFMLFDFIEVDTAFNWTMKYFALPIFVIIIPVCYVIYLKFIKQHERKKHKSIIKTQLRTMFRMFFLAFGLTFILAGTTLSLIILTNAYIGDSNTINLNAQIVDYYTTKGRGGIKHYIKIQDQQIDRIIDLKVQRQYQVGEPFNKTMKIGKWGLLYSEK